MGGGGQLGNDSYIPSATPLLVESLAAAGVKVASLSCGEQHTLFLADDGSVYSCGMAEYGRLGILENWNTDVLVPLALTEVFDGERAVQVSAGFNHSMALTEGGKVFSWGRNDQGQVSDKSRVTRLCHACALALTLYTASVCSWDWATPLSTCIAWSLHHAWWTARSWRASAW
jgi:alpha-tubulin suppressor-like RCC1 family protein